MKKHILSLLLLGFIQLGFAQKLINSYSYNPFDVKQIENIVNEKNKNTVLIFNQKEKSDFVLFDENFAEKSKITFSKDKKSFKISIGSSYNNQNYFVYQENDETAIDVISLNFNDKTSKISQIPFQLEKKEKIITTFNHKNSMFTITVIKNTDVMFLYIFNGTEVVKQKIDCKDLHLVDKNNEKVNLWDFFTERSSIHYSGFFKIFRNSFQTDLIDATQRNKIYPQDNQIVMSLDNNKEFSQFLFINLADFFISRKIFHQYFIPKNPEGGDYSDSNSFLVNNKIFLVRCNNNEVFTTIYDLDVNLQTESFLNETNYNNIPNFSPFEENGSFSKRETMKKPNKFFNRIGNHNLSLLCNFSNNNYNITIGSVSHPQQNGATMGGMFGALGAIAGSIIDASSSGALSKYNNIYKIYFNSSLDENFKPINKDIKASKLENFRQLIESLTKNDSFLENVEFNEKLFSLIYNKETNKINFYEF